MAYTYPGGALSALVAGGAVVRDPNSGVVTIDDIVEIDVDADIDVPLVCQRLHIGKNSPVSPITVTIGTATSASGEFTLTDLTFTEVIPETDQTPWADNFAADNDCNITVQNTVFHYANVGRGGIQNYPNYGSTGPTSLVYDNVSVQNYDALATRAPAPGFTGAIGVRDTDEWDGVRIAGVGIELKTNPVAFSNIDAPDSFVRGAWAVSGLAVSGIRCLQLQPQGGGSITATDVRTGGIRRNGTSDILTLRRSFLGSVVGGENAAVAVWAHNDTTLLDSTLGAAGEYAPSSHVVTWAEWQNGDASGILSAAQVEAGLNASVFNSPLAYRVARYGYAPLGRTFSPTVSNAGDDRPFDMSGVLIPDTAIIAPRATAAARTEAASAVELVENIAVYVEDNNASLPSALVLPTLSGSLVDFGSYDVVIDATAAQPVAFAAGAWTIAATLLDASIATTGTATLANGAAITGSISDASGKLISITAGGGAFTIAGHNLTTDTPIAYSADVASVALQVQPGEALRFAVWQEGKDPRVFNVTPDATTEGFVFDLLDNPNIDTGIDVSAELADIDTVVDASGITLRLGAMSPSFEEGKAIVHQLLKRENAIRSMIGANRGDVVVMDGVKFTINLPAFYTRKKVALTVSDTVKFNFFIDQSPAQALNPAFVVNPFDTNGRVEIDANPAALDPSTLAAAVVDALPEGTTGLTAQEVWEYATRTLTSGGGGGDDAATVYAYFTDATRPDAFKADVSALATAASVSALNDVSSVDVQAAATAALAAYDPPTRAEATADKDAIIAALPTAAPDAATVATAVRSELTAELGLIDVAVSTRATNAGVWAETSRTVTGVSGIDLAALHKTIQATTGRAVTAPDDLSTVVYDSDNATALLTFTHSADGRERTPS